MALVLTTLDYSSTSSGSSAAARPRLRSASRDRVGDRDGRQQGGAGLHGDGASQVSSRSAARARGAQTAEKRGLACNARRR